LNFAQDRFGFFAGETAGEGNRPFTWLLLFWNIGVDDVECYPSAAEKFAAAR
jgi:hypothetical protein